MFNFDIGFNHSSILVVDIHSTVHGLSYTSWYTIGSYYTFNIVIGLLGNSLALHGLHTEIIAKHTNPATKPHTRVHLTHLAISDIAVLVLQGISTVGVMMWDSWGWGWELCHGLGLVKYTMFYVTVGMTTLISAHKAYCLSFPFKTMSIRLRTTRRLICSVWVLSIILNILGVTASKKTFFDARFLSCNADMYLDPTIPWQGWILSTYLGISTIILMTSLAVILKVLWSRKVTPTNLSNRPSYELASLTKWGKFKEQLNDKSRTARIMLQQTHKGVLTTISIAVIFILTMIPVFFVHVVKYLGYEVTARQGLFQEVFVMINYVANPFIYSFTNPDFVRYHKGNILRISSKFKFKLMTNE